MNLLFNKVFKSIYDCSIKKINNFLNLYKNNNYSCNTNKFNSFYMSKTSYKLPDLIQNLDQEFNEDIDCINIIDKVFEGSNENIVYDNFYSKLGIVDKRSNTDYNVICSNGSIDYKNFSTPEFYKSGIIFCPITFNSHTSINNYVYNIYKYLEIRSKNIYKSCFISLFYYYFGFLFFALNSYKSNNINVLESNISIILAKLSTCVSIIELPTVSYFSYIFPIKLINIINNSLYLSNISYCSYRPYLIGLTKYILLTDGILSKLSFQETLRTLKNIVLEHKIDWNVDSKSNIVSSNFIPSGSGWYRYFIN